MTLELVLNQATIHGFVDSNSFICYGFKTRDLPDGIIIKHTQYNGNAFVITLYHPSWPVVSIVPIMNDEGILLFSDVDNPEKIFEVRLKGDH